MKTMCQLLILSLLHNIKCISSKGSKGNKSFHKEGKSSYESGRAIKQSL